MPDGFWARAFALVFGALPATALAIGANYIVVYGMALSPHPLALFMILYGCAAILATWSLWMIVFGFWSRLIQIGLIAGIVAMLPSLLDPRFPFETLPGWLGMLASNAVKLGPACVALYWLLRIGRAETSRAESGHRIAFGLVAFVLTAGFPFAALSANSWMRPVAQFWYGRSFEADVSAAIAKLPDGGNLCLFDDTRGMFVENISQLDADRMIERAVYFNTPSLGKNQSPKDHHFRVYAAGETFHWSFRERRLVRTGGPHALNDTGARLCRNYRKNAQQYERAFESRTGIAVSESNFRCIDADAGELEAD